MYNETISHKDNNEKQHFGKIMKVLRNNNIITRRISPELITKDSTKNFLTKIKSSSIITNNLKNNDKKIENISFEKYEDNPNFKKTDDIIDNYIYQELIDKLDNRRKLVDELISLVVMTIIIVLIISILYISYLEIII
jgi:hypothetical protein